MQTKIRILIVEDEAIIAENLKTTLIDLGYDVVDTCYNYNHALQQIKVFNFDLLLLDINLGDHLKDTGLHLAEKLAVDRKVPFIFLTAFSDKDTIINASKLKPCAYLVKPATTSSLFAAIQTAIENFNIKSTVNSLSEEPEQVDYFYCKTGNKMTKICWNDVVAIIAIKNYVKILTSNNTSGYLIRSSLQQIVTRMLPDKYQQQFNMISRNTVVNKDFILEVNSSIVKTNVGQFEKTR